MGLSANPSLPPIGGYSRDDLERMRYALMRDGGDPAMLGRISEVIGMRPANEERAGYDPEQVLLRPTPQKAQGMGNYRETQLKDQISRIVGARQQLLDALSPPKR